MSFKVGDKVNVYGDSYTPICNGVVEEVVGDNYTIRDGERPSFVVCGKNLRRNYTHISPSGLRLFESNVQEFYFRYVARYKPPSIPQTRPMSVGSAFDAYAKSFIIKTLAKGQPVPAEYEFEALFKTQVEEQNREWARKAGLDAFNQYLLSGALADLMLEVAQGEKEPKFEFEVKGLVKYGDGEVPLAGRPDFYLITKTGAHLVLDWKVNGFCSASGVSPKAGYIMCRDGWGMATAPSSRNNRQAHKDCMLHNVNGLDVNCHCYMETIDDDWALQLCTYAWLMGEPVGGNFVSGIEQLACAPGTTGPLIRIASFRNGISKQFQHRVYERYRKCWTALQTGVYFPNLTPAENDMKCLEMEKMAQTLNPTGNVNEDWFNNLGRAR